MKKQHIPFLEIEGINKIYKLGQNRIEVLKNVCLKIEEGEFVAIMGPSGSGKSTLMHILGLLDRPSGGTYKLYGSNVLKFNDEQTAYLRSKIIGFVFQQYNLLSRMDATNNVMLPLVYSRSKNRKEKAEKLLNAVGLADRAGHRPNQLSGGQQQRVAIARALVNNPKIIFADEPTGNLASKQSDEIMQILRDLNQKEGITIVLVTHEADIAQWADRVITIKDGMITEDRRKTEHEIKSNEPVKISKDYTGLTIAEIAENFITAVKSIMANKLRSFLTMLGILIGVAAIVAMLALGKSAENIIREQINKNGANVLYIMPGKIRKGGVVTESYRKMTVDDAYALLDNTELIEGVSPLVSGMAQVVYKNKNSQAFLQGVGPDFEEIQNAKPTYGRFFTQAEDSRMARVVLIGETIANKLFPGENPIGKKIKVNRKNFLVIGILPVLGMHGGADGDERIIVPVNTAMKRLLGTKDITWAIVQYREGKSKETHKYVLQKMLERYRLDISQADSFEVITTSEIIDIANSFTRTFSILLTAIAGIALVVGGIGIMNIMLVSISERTSEIGLRKAIGANNTAVLLQFLIEASVLSLMGGLLGIGFTYALVKIVAAFTKWSLAVSPSAIIFAVAFSAGVGIIFGFWPARSAAKMSPIEALKHESN